ncbi:MAG: hypothetical protein DMG04_26795 [Acidobacteria bacterium]|nr:MAG: hypothetical protein DMG04_26795 [Acidobacteriota bacterium]
MRVLAFLVALASAAAAQEARPVPRLPDGRPDLNGVWVGPYVPDMSRTGRNQRGTSDLPFTPPGRKDWESYDAANGDYTGSCMPFGLSRSINAPYPIQIVQTNKYFVLLFEVNNWFHPVFIDGRDHPPDLEPSWFGHSTGKWDGDTLVIETIGVHDWTRLDTVGHPHSEKLRLVTTYRRTDFDHLTFTVTVDDPETYTKPWTNERTFTRSNGELIEYSCEENNKDLREGHIKSSRRRTSRWPTSKG